MSVSKPLNVNVSEEVMAALDEVCSAYGYPKAVVAEAMLMYALSDEHVEMCIQQLKDRGDRRLRASRSTTRPAKATLDDGVLPLRRRAGSQDAEI